MGDPLRGPERHARPGQGGLRQQGLEAAAVTTGSGFIEIKTEQIAGLDVATPSASPRVSSRRERLTGCQRECRPQRESVREPHPECEPVAEPVAIGVRFAGPIGLARRIGRSLLVAAAADRQHQDPDRGQARRGRRRPSRRKLGPIAEQRSLTTIGAVVSSDLITQALILIIVGSIGILLWITYRFRDVKFGVTALVALLHDVIVVVGTFAILGTFFQVEIDALFVTAMLTVIGFSVHDTIVVFDRVRENKARHAGEPFADIVNHSILQTFGRSIMTSLTVVLTLLALLLFGGSAISDFILALLIGIISGTYSSIFVAAPLLVDWQLWDDRRHGRLTPSAQPAGPAHGVLRPPRTRPVDPRCSLSWHPDAVVEPRFRWTFPDVVTPSGPAADAARGLGLSSRLAGLLAARGATTGDDLDAWFADPLDGLHDPAPGCPDAAIVLARLRLARERGERVLVFGDFDADGLTGPGDPDPRPAPLRRRGRAVRPEPARRGSRPVAGGARRRRERRGATLIVTVDCGTTSVAEIAAANARGLDVIVTDHHRVPAVLPAALAIVNPHRPDSTYPDRRLAGSGVAFKVAQLLLADEPGGPAAALDLADLATIGSVADVAPIVGENRAIARLGLERLRRAPRPGIAALLERARIAPGRGRPRDRRVRHRPAAQRGRPGGGGARGRPSAARRRPGRGGDPRRRPRGRQPDAARPDEDGRRRGRAAVADGIRRRRRRSSAARGASASSGSWPPASPRIAGGRPSSGRSSAMSSARRVGATGSLDLGAALEACADLFIRHGGHAGAAGFELPADRWDAFRERFLGLAAAERRPADPARLDRDRPRAARQRGRLRPLPRAGAARAVRARATRPARRRPRPDRDPRPGRDRRPQPAHPPPRTATSSTASPSAGRTSPRSSTRATGSTSWRG